MSRGRQAERIIPGEIAEKYHETKMLCQMLHKDTKTKDFFMIADVI